MENKSGIAVNAPDCSRTNCTDSTNVDPESQGLKSRSEVHWARKVWHMLGVFIIFLLYRWLDLSTAKLASIAACVFFVVFDLVRLNFPAFNRLAIKVIRPIMRKNEAHRAAGTSYLLSGVALIVLFFPQHIVSMSLLFLGFGDPLASYVGIRFGRHKILDSKSLEGTLGAFVVCFLVSVVYLMVYFPAVNSIWLFSVLAGLVGALAELFPVWKLDDNLSMPLISALGLLGLFFVFGYI